MWFKWIFFSSITVSSKKFKTAGTSKLQGLKTPGGRREPGARDTHTRGEHTVTGCCTIEGEGLRVRVRVRDVELLMARLMVHGLVSLSILRVFSLT